MDRVVGGGLGELGGGWWGFGTEDVETPRRDSGLFTARRASRGQYTNFVCPTCLDRSPLKCLGVISMGDAINA